MKDLTTGSPLKQILIFAVPLLLGNICQQLYNVIDIWVVGRYCGKEALAAVGGGTSPLISLVTWFVYGVHSGNSIITGQYYGAKNMEKVQRSIAVSFMCCFIITIPVQIIAGMLAYPILRLMNTPDDVLDLAALYFWITMSFGGFSIVTAQLNLILRALGDSVTPLIFMIFSTLLNLSLNLFFVIHLGWGVAGVAWATIIAQVSAMVLSVSYALWKYPLLRLKWNVWKNGAAFYWEHLRLGLSIGGQNCITAFGIVVLQVVVNGFGTDALSGLSAMAPVEMLIVFPLGTVTVALSTYCAQNYGAGLLRRIRLGVYKTMIASGIFTIALSVLIFIFAPQLIGIFLKNNAENAEAIRYGVWCLRLVSPLYPVLVLLLIYRNALQGMGCPKYPFFGGVLEMISRLIGAFLLAQLFGFTGAVLSHPLAWIMASALLLIGYFRKIRHLKEHGFPDGEKKTA